MPPAGRASVPPENVTHGWPCVRFSFLPLQTGQHVTHRPLSDDYRSVADGYVLYGGEKVRRDVCPCAFSRLPPAVARPPIQRRVAFSPFPPLQLGADIVPEDRMYLTSDAPEDPSAVEEEPADDASTPSAVPQYGTAKIKPVGPNPLPYDAQESRKTAEALRRMRELADQAKAEPNAALDEFATDDSNTSHAAFAGLDAEETAFALALMRGKVGRGRCVWVWRRKGAKLSGRSARVDASMRDLAPLPITFPAWFFLFVTSG